MIKKITKDALPFLWEECIPHIERVIDHCEDLALGDIYRDILNEKNQLYVHATDTNSIEWLMVTKIVSTCAGKKIVVVALGGSNFIDTCLGVVVTFLRDWGNAINAKVEIPGREGWKRALKQHGGRVKYIVMEV